MPSFQAAHAGEEADRAVFRNLVGVVFCARPSGISRSNHTRRVQSRYSLQGVFVSSFMSSLACSVPDDAESFFAIIDIVNLSLVRAVSSHTFIDELRLLLHIATSHENTNTTVTGREQYGRVRGSRTRFLPRAAFSAQDL